MKFRIAFLLLFLSALPPISASTVSLTTFDTGTVPGTVTATPVQLTFTNKDGTQAHSPVSLFIGSNVMAAVKASQIAAALTKAGITANVDSGNNAKINMPDINPNWTVKFAGGTTGETADQLKTVALAPNGGFKFDNLRFSPLDGNGAPSTFTGGFVTDFGSLQVTLSSLQLPDTSGTAIASALFNALLPQAGAYGVTLGLNGSEVDMLFKPSLATGETGVIWGTTSPTDGSFGFINGAPEPRTSVLFLVGATVILALARMCRAKTRSCTF